MSILMDSNGQDATMQQLNCVNALSRETAMPDETRNKRVKPIVGGILSGGLSKRMGRTKDKIVLKDGRTMIQCVLDALLPVCNEVIVAGPELPLNLKEDERVHFIKDNFPGQGPLSGVEAILSSGYASGYIIAACDQPLLSEEILRLIVPEDREMPTFFDLSEEGIMQPFPAYYPVNWLSDIRDSLRRNRRSLKSLIADSDVILKPINKEHASRLRSFNTPDDLDSL